MAQLPKETINKLSKGSNLPMYDLDNSIIKPEYKGKGKHSIDELEEICEGYGNYIRLQNLISERCVFNSHLMKL